ncbi:MAG TPA: hypothetical protein ENO20_10995 [Bacteroides sp.]|nr:hypothetical protein [Bacteroides sp.]
MNRLYKYDRGHHKYNFTTEMFKQDAKAGDIAGIRPCLKQMRSSLPKLVRSIRFSSDTVYCGRHNHRGGIAGGISARC